MRDPNICRVVRFAPYRKGAGPTFTLTLWDGNYGRFDSGQEKTRYRLTMTEAGKTTVLFEGHDFGRAPSDASDSDGAVKGIMGFLTLRPGDTDADYFAEYTPEQLAFAQSHAEALSMEVVARFGEG
jgi:hypothetical protein